MDCSPGFHSLGPHVVRSLRERAVELEKDTGLKISVSVLAPHPNLKTVSLSSSAPHPSLASFADAKKSHDLVVVLSDYHADAFPTYSFVPQGKIVARFDAHGDADYPRDRKMDNSNYVYFAVNRPPLPGEHQFFASKIVNFGKPSKFTARLGADKSAKDAAMHSNIDTLSVDLDGFSPDEGLWVTHDQSDAKLEHVIGAAEASAKGLKTLGIYEAIYDPHVYESEKNREFVAALANAVLEKKARAASSEKK